MERVRKCFDDQGIIKNRKCSIALFATYLILTTLLTFLVAAYSYAAETLTLDQAIYRALKNNPGLKAADAKVEAADAGVLRSVSGFLPRVTASETWSRTDNPLMALGTKLNQEIVTPADFNPAVLNDPDIISNYNTRLAFSPSGAAEKNILEEHRQNSPGRHLSRTASGPARKLFIT